jgi:hypothetical protein
MSTNLIQRGGRTVVHLIIATTTRPDQTHHARMCINTDQLNRNFLPVSAVAVLNDSRWQSN